jgi:hypothetical protein
MLRGCNVDLDVDVRAQAGKHELEARAVQGRSVRRPKKASSLSTCQPRQLGASSRHPRPPPGTTLLLRDIHLLLPPYEHPNLLVTLSAPTAAHKGGERLLG